MRLLTFKEIREGYFTGNAIIPEAFLYITVTIMFICIFYSFFIGNSLKDVFIFILGVVSTYLILLPIIFYLAFCETYIEGGDK